MLKNPFFPNKGPISLLDIFIECNLKPIKDCEKIMISDVNSLNESSENFITFFHSIKYKNHAINTQAKVCITTEKLKNYLPKSCITIIVDNVLLSMAKVTKLFYPASVNDIFNIEQESNYSKFIVNNNVFLGKNVFIGKNVTIGNNTKIGNNTIIENNVIIGNECLIGSNVIIRNTLIKNKVNILDGSVIGKKGFGFFPINNNNFRYPHIGYVVLNDNCEIGANCTIDRGSLSITSIGKNTFLDNQVHVAHNVKIGDNCILAGQVGIAGSTTIGNNVMIGGQAGISGHLKIGNNVKIGGSSGVIKNIPDNSKVMGYPAKDIKEFIKKNRD